MRDEISHDSKAPVHLSGAQATLLITLLSRARELDRPSPILVDPEARRVLSQLAYDFTSLPVHDKTMQLICVRARKIDEMVQRFIDTNTHGVIVHLACGLDSRCVRLNRHGFQWYDVDKPSVIDLR